MKKLIIAMLFLASSGAYAEKVTGVGMNGFFVYQDGNGNKYVMHPTVPSVAYDLNGKRLESVPNGIKYATVQNDGEIVPLNAHSSAIFNALSWVMIFALIGGAIWWMIKHQRRVSKKREELEVVARLKENLNSEAKNIFIKFHKSFRPSQIDYLEQHTTDDFMNSVRDSVLKESDFKDVSFNSLKSEVESIYTEQGKSFANVKFNCVRIESANNKAKEIQSNEMWKFQLMNNKWILCDIKELAPAISQEFFPNTEKSKSVENEYIMENSNNFKL